MHQFLFCIFNLKWIGDKRNNCISSRINNPNRLQYSFFVSWNTTIICWFVFQSNIIIVENAISVSIIWKVVLFHISDLILKSYACVQVIFLTTGKFVFSLASLKRNMKWTTNLRVIFSWFVDIWNLDNFIQTSNSQVATTLRFWTNYEGKYMLFSLELTGTLLATSMFWIHSRTMLLINCSSQFDQSLGSIKAKCMLRVNKYHTVGTY